MAQSDFWSKLGITQSGGSRYGNGRNIPPPVRELVRLVYIEKTGLTKIRKDNLIVAELLRTQDPSLYKRLRKSAKEALSKP